MTEYTIHFGLKNNSSVRVCTEPFLVDTTYTTIRMKMHIDGVEKMTDCARDFVLSLTPHVRAATVVSLSGDLGAGKTTFTQGVARALAVEEVVTSPTFVIEKIYELSGQKWTRLIHIDAYRLKDMHELEVLGWHEIVQEPGNLILIEWPEMVASLIPKTATRITIIGSDDVREISVE